jgi:hypothetical protein
LACGELVTLAKDLIVSGAAIVGIVVAIKGLGTWQRQLRGQSEYELSRRILVSLYKYRDAINRLRHPAIWKHEIPIPSDSQAKGMSSDQIRFHGISKAYEARWDQVQRERTGLHADLLEAGALWGSDLKTLFKVLFDLEHEIFMLVYNHIKLIDPETSEDTKEAIAKINRIKRDIMYDHLSEDDEFRKDFGHGVEGIERYLKPKLVH